MNGFHIYNDNSWLRADLVDCWSHEIWEIKPIANLAGGVWQEAFYRVTHNLIRMAVRATMPQAVSRPRFLAGGGFWPVTETSSRGFALIEPIRVSSQARRPALAIPFQIGLLPGLIGYFVLRGPETGDLEFVIEFIIITALGEALRRMLRMLNELERLWGRAVQVARQIIQRLLSVLREIAEIVYNILLALAVFAAAVALGFVILALIPPAVAGLAAAGLVIVIVAAASAGQSGDDTGGDQQASAPGTTAVKIGNISITGVPADRVPEFLAMVETQFVEIAGDFARTLQRGGRSSVPVAPPR